jgi:hypothetical protein
MKLIIFEGSTFRKVDTDFAQPDGILVTLPAAWFLDFADGEAAFWRAMEGVNETENYIWHQTIGNIPTIEVPHVYLVFGGKVQCRLTVIEYERNKSMSFQRNGFIADFPNKNWVLLTGPVVKAPSDFLMRGFQGFRYCKFIF